MKKSEQYNKIEIGSLTLVSNSEKMKDLLKVANRILKTHGDKVNNEKSFPMPNEMFG